MDIQESGDLALRFSSMKVIDAANSGHCDIRLYEHPLLGKILTLDGEIQHVERWAPLYHEPLVHIPASFVPRPRCALILGGGSLFAAREVLKYKSMERVIMLDHDPAVIAIVARHYNHASSVLSDPRLHIRNVDLREGIASLDMKFDLVINDAVDLLKPGFALIEPLELLTTDGVFSDVTYRHYLYGDHAQRTLERLKRYPSFVLSFIFVPEYPGILHLLTVSGGSPKLAQDLARSYNEDHLAWFERPEESPCVYFDPRYLSYYLYLPPFIKTSIQSTLEVPPPEALD